MILLSVLLCASLSPLCKFFFFSYTEFPRVDTEGHRGKQKRGLPMETSL